MLNSCSVLKTSVWSKKDGFVSTERSKSSKQSQCLFVYLLNYFKAKSCINCRLHRLRDLGLSKGEKEKKKAKVFFHWMRFYFLFP